MKGCSFWPRPQSLRGRFTIANVSFLAAGLLLAAAASIAATYMVLIGQIDDALKASNTSLAQTTLGTDGLRQLCTLADLLQTGKGGSSVAEAFRQDLFIVLDPRGRPATVCRDGSLPIGAEQRRMAGALPDPARLARSGDAATVRSGETEYRVMATRLSDGTIVVKGTRLNGVKHAIGKLLVWEAGTGAVLLALLATGSLTAARRRLSPLEVMVETASAIAEGDLSRRVPAARHGSSEVEQLSSALNAMLQQIETALTDSERAGAQLRQFLADASHELRTPLASVRGYLQLYEKGMLDAEERDRALSRVSAEALRMSRLVDELLALARLDDRPTLAFRPVDLCGLVRDAAADLVAQQPERPLTLVLPDGGSGGRHEPGGSPRGSGGGPCDGPGGPGDGSGGRGSAGPAGRPGDSGVGGAYALGDEAGLRQVVGNLLGNVRVHTPADSPLVVEVTREPADTRTAGAAGGTGGAGGAGGAGGTGHGPAGTDGGDCPDGGTVVLRITDAGPGLALEDAARVFDRFFRAAPDRARGTGGAGLGMSIVQAVVQAHHGSVTLDTAPGRGVTVRVVLPAGGGEGGDSGDGDGGAGAGTTGGTGRGTAVSAAAPAATTT